MDYKFFSKIKNRKFSVCVIGLGYVGLPLISKLIEKKINVYGIDKDERKISLLKNGLKYIKNTNNLTLKYFKKNPEKLSKSFNLLSNIDVIIICLPTPLKKNSHNPDMSYIYFVFTVLDVYMFSSTYYLTHTTYCLLLNASME